MTDRADHLAWCKVRALEYLDAGNLADAVASMGSDLSKHPETKCPDVLMSLGMMLIIQNDEAGVRRWIEGFN